MGRCFLKSGSSLSVLLPTRTEGKDAMKAEDLSFFYLCLDIDFLEMLNDKIVCNSIFFC